MLSEKTYIERLTIRPSLVCNFRCKLCNEYSPHYKSDKIQPLEQVKNDVDRIFQLVDYIEKLEISGGEPLLYKSLPQVLTHILKYNHRFDFFSLVTNGSLLIDENLLYCLSAIGKKVRVIVDDYGVELSKNARENIKLLGNYNIRYELRDQHTNVHSDGWFDFNDFSYKHSNEQAKEIFSHCVCPQKLHWVITLFNGHLYPCHFLRRCIELDIISKDPTECINLYDEKLTDIELKRNISGLYKIDLLSACKYCDGFIEGRERKKPAEQI